VKSALEIALERTKDIAPSEDPNALTAEEKAKVRELNKLYDSKIAELEIQFTTRLRALAEQHGEREVTEHMEQFSGELRSHRDTINAERATELENLMKSFGK
jgi:hypothetical protein